MGSGAENDQNNKKKGRKIQKQTTRQNQDRCPLFPSYYYNMLSPPDLTWSPSNTIKKPVKSNLDAVMSSSSFRSSAILSRSYVQAFPLPNVPLLNASQIIGPGIFFGAERARVSFREWSAPFSDCWRCNRPFPFASLLLFIRLNVLGLYPSERFFSPTLPF